MDRHQTVLNFRTPQIPPKGWIAFGHDILMAAVSFPLALYLRIGDDIWRQPFDVMAGANLFFVVEASAIFFFLGLYRGVWRYASINDLLAITKAVTLAIGLFVIAMFVWVRLEDFPRSLFFIQWFLLIGMLGGPRFGYRILKDRRIPDLAADGYDPRIPILLAGAGDEAELFIRGLAQTDQPEYRVVGLLSERPDRVGQFIRGIEVRGTVSQFSDVVASLDGTADYPRRLVLTRDGMDGTVVRHLLSESERLGLVLARLPRVTDFRDGATDKLALRPIAVEDLLGRPQTPLDRDAMANLVKGRRVLVTGAGGSIGGELSRQICKLNPDKIVLLDQSELALYEIDLEISRDFPDIDRDAIIGDVRDSAQMARLFSGCRPDLVFHAAALKHVPLVEANPSEGLATNALGTLTVAQAAQSAGTAAMVMISTDKAVNPTSVMGASKRLAEIACQAMDLESKSNGGTRYVTVRFGNVLGSTGSVVPLFQRQLAEGGPLTVTHPDMTRYFMTVREAVELVLSASTIGVERDADGRIFVLDMGEPVKIVDLARQMIRLAGFEPDQDVQIEFTGLRPGEKLFEEVFHGDEAPAATDQPGVLLAKPRTAAMDRVIQAFQDLDNACRADDLAAAESILADLVPEFTGTVSEPAGLVSSDPSEDLKAKQA